MVLVVTNNNDIENMILQYIQKNNIVLENNIIDINEYVDKELMSKKVELIDKVIIDINSFTNNKEEILKAIARIKIIYDIQIIIIAIGYKVGSEILSNLFELGIYDFIISNDKAFQDEEFRKALKGNNYIDSIKFKVEDKGKKKVKSIKSKIKKVERKKNKRNLRQISKQKILVCLSFMKNLIVEVIKIIGYILLMFLMSVGATALINSNIREILIEILKGGI